MQFLQREVAAHVASDPILLSRPRHLRKCGERGSVVLATVDEDLEAVGALTRAADRATFAAADVAPRALNSRDDPEDPKQIQARIETRQTPEVVDDRRPRHHRAIRE